MKCEVCDWRETAETGERRAAASYPPVGVTAASATPNSEVTVDTEFTTVSSPQIFIRLGSDPLNPLKSIQSCIQCMIYQADFKGSNFISSGKMYI